MALETNASYEPDRPWLEPRPRDHGRLAFTGGGEMKTVEILSDQHADGRNAFR